MAELDSGAIKKIYDTNDTSLSPTVQVYDVKKIGANNANSANERYRIVISDGVHYQQAMLATQMNDLVRDGKLQTHCCVRLKQYICNTVQGKKIIIVLDLEIVCPPTGARIGNASNVETASSTAAPAAAKPAAAAPQSFAQAPQQQQHQQQQQQQQQGGQQRYGSPPASSYGSRPVQRMSPVSDQNVRAIEQLNPYCSPWTIKAIIDSKGDMRTWNKPNSSGKLFSVTLKDNTGRIRATAFKEDADRLYAELQVGKTYLITRGSIKPANRQYCDFHDYEITFGRDTAVQEASGGFEVEYNFVKIGGLEQIEPGKVVDICGVATAISEVQEITARKDGRLLKKRNITVLDDSNASIELTLWGGNAEEFTPEAPGAPPPVVVVRNGKVSDWNGRSLSFSGESSIMRAPDVAEAHRMRGWYDQTGIAADVKNMSAGGGGSGGGPKGPNTENRKSFKAAKDEGVNKAPGAKPINVYNNRATITHFRHDGTIAYPSCPDTKKKLIEISENVWKNESTGKEFPEPQWRYCISLKAEDQSGVAWMTAFDDTAKQLLGMDAGELQKLKVAGELDPVKQGEYNAVFENATGLDHVFRCVLKEDTWQDEVRLKNSIVASDKIDYAGESKHILANLAARGITY